MIFCSYWFWQIRIEIFPQVYHLSPIPFLLFPDNAPHPSKIHDSDAFCR